MDLSTAATLPLEILLMITSHSGPPDLAAATLVNKEWSTVFNPYLWRTVSLDCQIDDTPSPRFSEQTRYLRLKAVIEAGALARNRKWIQTIRCRFYGIVELLLMHGQPCTGLQELSISSRSDPVRLTTDQEGSLPDYEPYQEPWILPVDLAPLITLLQQEILHVRPLTLHNAILHEGNRDLMKVIDSLSPSLENLELQFWEPFRRYGELPLDRTGYGIVSNINDDDLRDALDDAMYSSLLNLKRLAFTNYAVDSNKRTLRRLLTVGQIRAPQDYSSKSNNKAQVSLTFVTSLLRKHCPRLVNLHLVEWGPLQGSEVAHILRSSTAGWRDLGVPQRFDEQLEFGDLSDKALLEHASTLENLRQDGNYLLESSTICWRVQLSSSPSARRLT